MVANNLVSNSLGTINPVEKLAAWAHEQGAIMVVDAAQAARTADRRAGARLRLPRHLLAQALRPERGRRALGEGGAARGDVAVQPRRRDDPLVALDRTSWNELPYKFEAGTPAIAEAYGFGVAIDYFEIGLDAIAQHEHELTEYALGRLGELDWVRIFDRRSPRRNRVVRRRGHPPPRRRPDPRLGVASPSAPATTARSR